MTRERRGTVRTNGYTAFIYSFYNHKWVWLKVPHLKITVVASKIAEEMTITTNMIEK